MRDMPRSPTTRCYRCKVKNGRKNISDNPPVCQPKFGIMSESIEIKIIVTVYGNGIGIVQRFDLSHSDLSFDLLEGVRSLSTAQGD